MKEKKNHVQKSDVTKFIDEVANNGKSSIKLYSAKTLKEEKKKSEVIKRISKILLRITQRFLKGKILSNISFRRFFKFKRGRAIGLSSFFYSIV